MPVRQSRQSKLDWRKSTASNDGANCVEVAATGRLVLVRDSIDRAATRLVFTPAQWSTFVRYVQVQR